MKYSAAVIDTNVVVAGLLTGNTDSPTARILDAMCKSAFPFLLATALLKVTRVYAGTSRRWVISDGAPRRCGGPQ
jgi:hypothetical protein